MLISAEPAFKVSFMKEIRFSMKAHEGVNAGNGDNLLYNIVGHIVLPMEEAVCILRSDQAGQLK